MKDVLVWELVLLADSPLEVDRAVSIQLVVLATGSLGSGPRDHRVNATSESAMLTVWRPSTHLMVSIKVLVACLLVLQ